MCEGLRVCEGFYLAARIESFVPVLIRAVEVASLLWILGCDRLAASTSSG